MSILAELRQKRGSEIDAARKLNDRVESENRDFNAEEKQTYDEHMDAQAGLQARIERLEKQEKLDRDMAALASDAPAIMEANGATPGAVDKAMQAFTSALVNGAAHLPHDLRAALDTTTTPNGGALVAPEQFVRDLVQAVDDQTFIRNLANVVQVTGTDTLGIPSLDTDVSDANWTTELGTGAEDAAMAFGKRQLTPQALAKRIKVSETLLRRSAIPVEQIVRERLAYKFGVTQEKAFLTGTGTGQPLGVFTASANGVPTTRDVVAAGAAAITGDDLINVKYSLKGGYHANAQWVLNRAVVKEVAKLKDANGAYIWRNGLVAGESDRLLDMPVNMSEYAPGTITTGLYTAVLGDFSKYWIAEEASFSLKRLEELYAETNQIGIIARTHIDGMPVVGEAFARLKQA